MSKLPRKSWLVLPILSLTLAGCSVTPMNVAALEQPGRAGQLNKYDMLVGSWTWEGEVIDAADTNRHWKGTADWHWTLEEQCLHSSLTATSDTISMKSYGAWTWHPAKEKYVWYTLNNWGYPEHGAASYDAATKTWTLTYNGIALDGRAVHGSHTYTLTDRETMTWTWKEGGRFGQPRFELQAVMRRR